jgi:hypothetical protein
MPIERANGETVELLWTVRQTSKATGWCEKTVRGLLGKDIPVVRHGRSIRVDPKDVQAFIEANKTGGRTDAT